MDEFDLSDNGKTIAFISNEDGYGVLHLFRHRDPKRTYRPEAPKGIISNVKWHKNNRDLGFEFNSAKSNDDVYSIDVQTGKLDRWTESETGASTRRASTSPT